MDTYDDDAWISAYNFLEPLQDLPTCGMHMRDTFDENVYLMDGFLHHKWQGVLQAVDPPPYFEIQKKPRAEGRLSDVVLPFETENTPSPALSMKTQIPSVPPPPTTSVFPAPTNAVGLSSDVQAPVPVPSAHGRVPQGPAPLMNSRCVAKFVRDMFREHDDSVGEVAQYFGYFIVDVYNKGPFDLRYISYKYNVSEYDLLKIWNFRPGKRRFKKTQVAFKLHMTVPQMTKAYFALGFKTWML
jgi:hypothetical protein